MRDDYDDYNDDGEKEEEEVGLGRLKKWKANTSDHNNSK